MDSVNEEEAIKRKAAEMSGWEYDEYRGRPFWDNGRDRVWSASLLPEPAHVPEGKTFWCNAHSSRADYLVDGKPICPGDGPCDVVDLSAIAEIE